MPPILRPMWSSASSKELRMSLPIAAVGPLKVEIKPILMVSAATAGCASARAAMPASQNAFFILVSPPIYRCNPVRRDGGTGRAGLYKETCFVRKSAGLQQAPTERPLLEPSAYAPASCTIIQGRRGNQEL